MYDGKEVMEATLENTDLFQYRENQQSKRRAIVRIKDSSSSFVDSEPREFKVRLIETLSGMERDLCQYENNGNNSSENQNEKLVVNFEQLKFLENSVLEKINRGYFVRVIRLILLKMERLYDNKRCKMILNKRDENGMALIHYVICLDYSEVISDLYKIGANLKLKTDFPINTAQNQGQ